ncbi:MAG: AmmeMemoRadiSam system protein B [Ketobacter sp.]|nr:AmmeMemoRadiSam system protein B [Ketobacter sp.]
MRTIREPAVAGLFYPDQPQILDAAVEKYLSGVPANKNDLGQDLRPPKALIVPHAGYLYSGATAARAYHELALSADQINRVVLLGPSHRVGFHGIAFCGSDFYRTPLGDIPIDHSALAIVSELPQVGLLDQAHEHEHSLEVQLPFLQKILRNFKLVPLVVGEADTESVAEVIERLWGGEETLFVISSDLSHFHDYATAQQMDAKTCDAIESMTPAHIDDDQACGRNPVKGLLNVARRRHMRVKTLDMCNSGDTTGDHDRVVGYGAWAFWEAS